MRRFPPILLLLGANTAILAARYRKLGGTFHVEAYDSTIDDAKGGVFYHLKADYLK